MICVKILLGATLLFFFAFHNAGVESLFPRTDMIIARFARWVGGCGFSQRWRRSAVGCQARQNENRTSGQHTKHALRHVFCVAFSSFFFFFFSFRFFLSCVTLKCHFLKPGFVCAPFTPQFLLSVVHTRTEKPACTPAAGETPRARRYPFVSFGQFNKHNIFSARYKGRHPVRPVSCAFSETLDRIVSVR